MSVKRRKGIVFGAVALIVAAVIVGALWRFFSPADADYRQRREAASRWLGHAIEVANQTRDPEIGAVALYLRDYHVLGKPIALKGEGAVMSLDSNPQTQEFFYLVPVFEKDCSLPGWEFLKKGPIDAFFYREGRALVVKDFVPMTPMWQGILILHEGDHALLSLREDILGRLSKEERAYAFEYQAHSQNCKIVRLIGGERYQMLLDEQTEHIVKMGTKISAAKLDLSRDVKADLDAIFGPALSNSEQVLRNTTLLVNASFNACERFFPKDLEGEAGCKMRVLEPYLFRPEMVVPK